MNDSRVQIIHHDLFESYISVLSFLVNVEYVEDDILIPRNAILYWLTRHSKLFHLGYNLGFVRIETEKNKKYNISQILMAHI